jgi:hypothetical protein
MSYNTQHTSEFAPNTTTSKDGKTDVEVKRVVKDPVIVEHHHHHTHTVVHPEVKREHDTTEIRHIIQPIHEHVKSGDKVEHGGEKVKVVEKKENLEDARRKLEGHHEDVRAKADITHTKDKSTTVDDTKVKDIHTGHKVIEEVNPVIIRDVDHTKIVHKDEKLIEKIHHAPEVKKEEKHTIHKDETHGLGHKDEHGLEHKHKDKTHGLGHKDEHGLEHNHKDKTHGLGNKDEAHGLGHQDKSHGLGHKDEHGLEHKHKDKTHGLGHKDEHGLEHKHKDKTHGVGHKDDTHGLGNKAKPDH